MAFGAVVLAVTMSGNANAFDLHGHDHHDHGHDHGHVGFGVGFGYSESSYVSGGHYELRTETFMVAPERVEQRFIPAVYRTEVGTGGVAIQVLVRDGFWESYTLPAQYESRTVSVWVADCYSYSSPAIRVGFRF